MEKIHTGHGFRLSCLPREPSTRLVGVDRGAAISSCCLGFDLTPGKTSSSSPGGRTCATDSLRSSIPEGICPRQGGWTTGSVPFSTRTRASRRSVPVHLEMQRYARALASPKARVTHELSCILRHLPCRVPPNKPASTGSSERVMR